MVAVEDKWGKPKALSGLCPGSWMMAGEGKIKEGITWGSVGINTGTRSKAGV